MTWALLFPGQGSQAVGMGAALAAAHAPARAVFEEVNEALSQDLTSVMWAGPEEALRLTANAQPALMAHSIATLRTLEAEFGLDVTAAQGVAGHSLGEYSALCAAGALSLGDTARLLRLRGDAMQAAVPVGEGAMAAIIGLDLAALEAVMAADGTIVDIANDNSPGQLVISGTAPEVDRISAAAKAAGAKRTLPLPVSAPFHSCLMAPAAQKMHEALRDVTVNAPVVPVYANVTAAATSDPEDIRRLLVDQVTGRVRWTESVQAMARAGVGRFIELGTGKVLAGLVRRIVRDARVSSVGAPGDLEGFTV